MDETSQWIKAREEDLANGGSRALDAFTLGLDRSPSAYPAPRTY